MEYKFLLGKSGFSGHFVLVDSTINSSVRPLSDDPGMHNETGFKRFLAMSEKGSLPGHGKRGDFSCRNAAGDVKRRAWSPLKLACWLSVAL